MDLYLWWPNNVSVCVKYIVVEVRRTSLYSGLPTMVWCPVWSDPPATSATLTALPHHSFCYYPRKAEPLNYLPAKDLVNIKEVTGGAAAVYDVYCPSASDGCTWPYKYLINSTSPWTVKKGFKESGGFMEEMKARLRSL